MTFAAVFSKSEKMQNDLIASLSDKLLLLSPSMVEVLEVPGTPESVHFSALKAGGSHFHA